MPRNGKYLNGIFISLVSLFLLLFMHFSSLPIKNVNASSEGVSVGADIIRPAFVLGISVPQIVNLNLTPNTDGRMTVAAEDIRVLTSSPNGYELFLEMTGENANTNSLVSTTNSGFEIVSNGTYESPQPLTNGVWGYALSSSEDVILDDNGFDSNYDTMQSATPTSSKFASIPTTDEDVQKIAESEGWGEDIVTVYYGLRAGVETAAGTYANKVLYTALADDVPKDDLTLSPAAIFERGGEPLLITTPLFSTNSDIEAHVYLLTPTEYAAVTRSEDPVPITDYPSSELTCSQTEFDALQLRCTTIESPLGTNYIYVDVPHFGHVYSSPIPIKDTTPENMWELKTLQGFDDWPALCTNLVTPSITATREVTSWAEYSAVADKTTVIPTHTMIDVRDGEAYKVKKLADGKCWMTDNLRIEGVTLTSADTNIPAGTTIDLPASSTRNWCNGNSANCYHRLLVLNYGDAGNTAHPEYGSYYNWYTATATYGMRSTTTDTDYSICPAGWRLPKGGPSGEFEDLYNAGYNTPAKLLQDIGGPHFVLSGAREAGSTQSAGEIGRWWSSTPTTDQKRAYRFLVSETSVQPSDPNIYGKHRGLSVRCINAN